MSAPVQRGDVIVTPYPGVCRCAGARDVTGARTTHYSDNPECNTNPENTNEP